MIKKFIMNLKRFGTKIMKKVQFILPSSVHVDNKKLFQEELKNDHLKIYILIKFMFLNSINSKAIKIGI